MPPVTLDDLIDAVHRQFRNGPPNGWDLGWDRNRCFEAVSAAAAPHRTTNCTSFDDGFCNWFEVQIDSANSPRSWTLTILLSFIAPVCSLYWSRYSRQSGRGGVVSEVPVDCQTVEARVRAALAADGFVDLPDEWHRHTVDGIELELSGSRNITLNKCLFVDYDR